MMLSDDAGIREPCKLISSPPLDDRRHKVSPTPSCRCNMVFVNPEFAYWDQGNIEHKIVTKSLPGLLEPRALHGNMMHGRAINRPGPRHDGTVAQ